MATWIERRWAGLDPAPDKPIFQLIDAEHPLRFYVGREITGEYLLLLVEPRRPPVLKSMRAVQITSFRRPDGEWALLLKLTAIDLLSIFALLCEDLVTSSKAVGNRNAGSKFVATRLNTWQRMFKESNVPQLSASEVRGLFGELHFLECYLLPTIGMTEAVDAWTGPFGADQDFQTVDQAFEVKTIHPDAPLITIASETQLHSSTRSIYLAVLSVFETISGSGTSLNKIVASLRAKASVDPIASNALEERLEAARYVVREEYDTPVFSAVRLNTYSVGGTFPRIEPAGLTPGVVNVRYQLQLAACREHEVEFPFTIVSAK